MYSIVLMLYTDGMENTQQLDPQMLQNLISNSSVSTPNLIPESLTNILATSLLISLGLMVVFVILFIISLVRKWKVQSAVLKMQKDVADIRQALVKPIAPVQPEAPRSEEPRKVEIATNS